MAECDKKDGRNGRRGCTVVARRTSPVEFYKQVVARQEVTWPSWKETWLTTMMVFIIVAWTWCSSRWWISFPSMGEYFLIGGAENLMSEAGTQAHADAKCNNRPDLLGISRKRCRKESAAQAKIRISRIRPASDTCRRKM